MKRSIAKKEKSVVSPVKETSRIIPGWGDQFAEGNLMHKFSFHTNLTGEDFTNMPVLFSWQKYGSGWLLLSPGCFLRFPGQPSGLGYNPGLPFRTQPGPTWKSAKVS